MSKFEDYFNKEFIELKDKQKDIKELLTSKNMYLISGDFYGIQKFIFDGLTTKNAAKVLRAKCPALFNYLRVNFKRYL